MAGASRLPILIQARPPARLAYGDIFLVQRGVLVQIPVIPPLDIQVGANVACDALLAHPTPGEHPDKINLIIELAWKDPNFQITVLRHIVLAVAGAVYILGECRSVSSL